MHRRTTWLALAILAPLGLATGSAQSADLTAPPLIEPPPQIPTWTYRFVPYGWLIGLRGTQTVRGRSVKINASFIDVAEKADTLVGLMGDFEARNGPFSLYANAVWTKVDFAGKHMRTRSLAPGITGTLGASVAASTQLGIVEFGAFYEIARLNGLAIDVVAGGRYWFQEADLSFDLAGTVDTSDLRIADGRAIAKSGSIDWLDPMVGARLRYTIAPGHELFLRGDIGGFNVGSKFSWQAIGGYGVDFAIYKGVTFSGIIGYRALFVDYVRGQGRTRYEYDMLQHGPILGISMKW
ncbi:hypothetical protein [Microvirga terricola]|uniref:Outer membrane protein beta-barrel domain-containing protein n=1 Tax=Microvirga terricola TaxID=2719797 RepID=A0ABX0V8E7_9HYPH|nr:hypothetical protein [Microvirga terricola]NIX76134.1 hypothetical protein [Microvirga terricola]